MPCTAKPAAGVVVPMPILLFQLFTTNLLVPIENPPASVLVAVVVVAVKYGATIFPSAVRVSLKRPFPATASAAPGVVVPIPKRRDVVAYTSAPLSTLIEPANVEVAGVDVATKYGAFM